MTNCGLFAIWIEKSKNNKDEPEIVWGKASIKSSNIPFLSSVHFL